MRLRFVKGIACAMLVSVLFGGCGQKGELDTTSVYIRKDGSVSSAVYEPFDVGIYSKDELQVFVEDAVSAYNQKNAGVAAAYTDDTKELLSVAISSLEVKDSTAALKMEYASCEDYLQFNESEGSLSQLASGTVEGAVSAGIDMSRIEVLTAEGTDKVKGDELDSEYHVVFVEGTSVIVVEGTIKYVTAGVTIEDKDTAQVSSDGALACIVFK